MTRLDIALSVEKISNVLQQRDLVNKAIQVALYRVYQYFDWPYYLQWGAIKTTATYSTGTAIVANGSATVTGVGTTWTASMVGRKFRHSEESAYYRIVAVGDVDSLTLDNPYQGVADAVGSAYTIYKDEYRLAPDLDKNKTAIQIQNRIPMFDIPPGDFDRIHPTPSSYADPVLQVQSGTRLDSYSTGTVTTSGNTITGTSTAWLSVEGLGRMTRIIVSGFAYTVKSVDSDTQITTYENLQTIAVGTSYKLEMRNILVQLYQIPDSQKMIYYRYYRIPEFMANDYDNPDMPNSWEWVLIYGALSMVFLEKGDMIKGQNTSEAQFLNAMEKMKIKIGSFVANRIYKKQSVDQLNGVPNDGLERSAFDRRWSSV